MKNTFKIVCSLGLALLFILVGCTPESVREPSPTVDGPALHFDYNVEGSTINIDPGTSAVNIILYRTNAEGSSTLSVPVTFTDESGLFSVASPVTIPAGADRVVVPVSYDLDDLEWGKFYPLSLEITEDTTPYGISAISFSAGRPLIWKNWARGTYTSGAEWFDGTKTGVVLQKADYVDRFRIAAYTTAYYTFEWDITNKATSIRPLGSSATLGGTPVIYQSTGLGYNYQDANRAIYLFTDYDPEYTFYDPETQTFTLNSYNGIIVDGSVLGFGWYDDTYEITEFLQDNPWE